MKLCEDTAYKDYCYQFTFIKSNQNIRNEIICFLSIVCMQTSVEAPYGAYCSFNTLPRLPAKYHYAGRSSHKDHGG